MIIEEEIIYVKAKILRKGKAPNPLLYYLMRHEQSSFVQEHLFYIVIYSSATISLNGILFEGCEFCSIYWRLEILPKTLAELLLHEEL